MVYVALTGTVSHISMGAKVNAVPMFVVVISCLIGAVVSARFANQCEIKRLNHTVGMVLAVLGIAMIAIKIL